MTIDTVAVHHTEHPKARHPSQIFLNAVTVLINLTHLRDESCAGGDAQMRYYFRASRLALRRLHQGFARELTNFLFLRVLNALGGRLPTNVEALEIGTSLQVAQLSQFVKTSAHRGRIALRLGLTRVLS